MKEIGRISIVGAGTIGHGSFPMVAQSVLLRGNVRVGFENDFFLARGNRAKSNAQLVEKTVTILNALDMEPASPQEARKIPGLT